ncbi:hypothetical protein AAES_119453 [Amazona aestiva]|uniref:Uncharacterized protein n=1 Tax=Amazona aestiva TaxID=12930 RepID=A0A0Q3TC62_AMAAE|nr:hypothetical protein AAES_119453 [Amazona aestiva]
MQFQLLDGPRSKLIGWMDGRMDGNPASVIGVLAVLISWGKSGSSMKKKDAQKAQCPPPGLWSSHCQAQEDSCPEEPSDQRHFGVVGSS